MSATIKVLHLSRVRAKKNRDVPEDLWRLFRRRYKPDQSLTWTRDGRAGFGEGSERRGPRRSGRAGTDLDHERQEGGCLGRWRPLGHDDGRGEEGGRGWGEIEAKIKAKRS